MDHYTRLHGIIIKFFLALKLGLWNCQDPAIFLTPLNLEIHSDSSLQRVFVEWYVNGQSYGPGLEMEFHIQVARSQNMNIIWDEIFTRTLSRTGNPFRWTWDSQLPLECDSHSVRIQSAVLEDDITLDKHWSMWSPWKTHYGQNKEDRKDIVIYPHEKIVLEGSDVSFCCLSGQNEKVEEMRYRNKIYSHQSPSMWTESFVITMKNLTLTRSDGNTVYCRVDNGKGNGTVVIVTKPPDEIKHFSCETQDMQTLRCSWRPGPLYNFYKHRAVNYTLQEGLSGKSSSCPRDECTWSIVRNQQIYRFTLTARNLLGERSIYSIVNLTERIRPLAPSNLVAHHVNASHVTLNWYLKADYTSLLILCQTDLQKSVVNTTIKGKMSSELYSVSLTGLETYTKYDLRVRCMSDSSLAGWSNWSQVVSIRTHEEVPTGALDIWRKVEDVEGGRVVTLYWRPSPAYRANGAISHYNIKWRTLEDAPVTNQTRVSAQQNSSRISMGIQAYAISITARNGAGSSPATEIRIPGVSANGAEIVTSQRTYGRDGGIYVMWKQNSAVHGYVVEWCNVPRSPHCDLQWRKYNSSVHKDVVKSSVFRPGVRYDFLVYGSMEDGEHLLGNMTGYTVELASSVKPKVKVNKIEANSLSLDWSPYSTDESQEGFVTGYNIYVKNSEGDCNLDKMDDHKYLDGSRGCRFFIGDPETMQNTINNLKANTQYGVAVAALTNGGESPMEFIKADTPQDTGAVIISVLLPVIMVSVLALALLFIGCWKRAWLKEMCYPDIPDPNKSNILSFSAQKGVAARKIPATGCIHQEVEVVSVQEIRNHIICEEMNDTTYYQPDLIYTTIQRNNETSCGEDSCYLPSGDGNANPLEQTSGKLLYMPQITNYMEFFNQNYTSTSDDTLDSLTSLGYRPQTDVAQIHHPSYDDQSAFTHLDPRPDDMTVGFGSDPAFQMEPRSPTSITSTTFILAD